MSIREIGYPSPADKELPLPSDSLLYSADGLVRKLEVLWMVIWRKPKEEREKVQNELINRFFRTLDERQMKWLEGDDPKHKTPRAILVKERAIQLCQKGDTALLDMKENRELVQDYLRWIQEVKVPKTASH